MLSFARRLEESGFEQMVIDEYNANPDPPSLEELEWEVKDAIADVYWLYEKRHECFGEVIEVSLMDRMDHAMLEVTRAVLRLSFIKKHLENSQGSKP